MTSIVTATTLLVAFAVLLTAEKAWRCALVVRFFRRPAPAPKRTVRLVSILQPILSGDPTLPECLARNLAMRTGYATEWLWLVDTDDTDAHALCQELIARHPGRAVQVIGVPPPLSDARQNPKTIKLIVGAQFACGDVLCVLDDDTTLPDHGLEQCLPFLDQAGVGLAFGLPFYVHFANLWSTLVSCFVNMSSLLTYIPYTFVADPFTINGMFYAVRRNVLEAVGGFRGLEATLADDFAVARRFRAHGYRLAQTPLRHAIRTHVAGASDYFGLMQRWFLFPRESLLRHLSGRDKMVVFSLGLIANVAPFLLALGALLFPTPLVLLATLGYALFSTATVAGLNASYLHATPRCALLWWTPLLLFLFPLQLLVALARPKPRLVWRGHLMEAEKGGGFRVVRVGSRRVRGCSTDWGSCSRGRKSPR